jgi:hypothetical protein
VKAVVLSLLVLAAPATAQLPADYYPAQESDRGLVAQFVADVGKLASTKDGAPITFYRSDAGGGLQRTQVDRVAFAQFLKGCSSSAPSVFGIGSVTVEWACSSTPANLKGPTSIFAVRNGKIESVSYGWIYPLILCCSAPQTETK